MEHTGILFLREINGFPLNETDQCVIFPATEEGAFLPPGTLYMCSYDMKARRKASLLTATRKLENIFPSISSVWLHLHLPNGGCAHTFAGINLVVYLDFPSLICFNEITGDFCGQIYPKLELSFLGIPANRAHPKRDSTNSNNRLNNTI